MLLNKGQFGEHHGVYRKVREGVPLARLSTTAVLVQGLHTNPAVPVAGG
ncbi:hypothetical protein [Streptomyces cyaneofuscatus]|nr:hypothetical protein OG366_30190 [Streptomyces cyaneofuscatus]